MDSSQPPTETATSTSRRAVLGAVGGGALVATAGCVRRVRSLFTLDEPSSISLTVKTLPADADARATRVARYLAQQFEAVGIGAEITPVSRETLYRDVLLNQQFDVFVAPFPGAADPDFLRSLLHSRFGAESGWQNPYGYANLDLDDLLERQQRQSGNRRQQTLAEIQHSVVRHQPFTVVAFPDEIRAARSSAYTGWPRDRIHSPLGYLGLEAVDASDDEVATPTPGETRDERVLRMTLSDSRATENLNPIAAEFRAGGTVTGLLYDPLGRWIDGGVRPWMAESWNWTDPSTSDAPTLTVSLRPDLSWHDGTAITASDVAFTYEFLRDTSLGRLDSPVPTSRFRGPASLVTGTEVVDDRTVSLTLDGSSRSVGVRSLTVPVLPEHVWTEKAGKATVAGLDVNGSVTEALVWRNTEPVGSGPLQVERRKTKESLILVPREDHFLTRDGLDDHLQPYAGGFAADRLAFLVVPSGAAALELVGAGEADATATTLDHGAVPQIGRRDGVELFVDRPKSFYQIGYNVRRSPLSSPRFRRGIARLVDKEYLAKEVFGGFGEPAASPLARHEAVAPDLVWEGQDPELPFVGENGTLDVDRARESFRQAGYRYSEDGDLLAS